MARSIRCIALSGSILAASAASAAASGTVCIQHGSAPATPCPAGFDHVYQSIAAALPSSSGGGGGAISAGASVQIEPGTYAEAITQTGLPNLTVHGDPAAARPVITAAPDGNTHSATWFVADTSGGTTLRHLEVDGTSTSGYPAVQNGTTFDSNGPSVTLDDLAVNVTGGNALDLEGDSTVTNVVATASTTPAALGVGAQLGHGTHVFQHDTITGHDAAINSYELSSGLTTTVEDSKLQSENSYATASVSSSSTWRRVTITGGSRGINSPRDGATMTIENSLIAATDQGVEGHEGAATTLRNDTVIATGATSYGIYGSGGGNVAAGDDPGAVVNVSNSIVRGGSHDAFAAPSTTTGCGSGATQSCAGGSVSIQSSDVRRDGADNTTDRGSNISSDPLFVNGTSGPSQDLHLMAGSPAIGTGAAVPAGDTDLDGNARPTSGVDMGAYQAAAGTPGLPSGGVGATPGGTSGNSAGTAPVTNGGALPSPTVLPPSNVFSITGKPAEVAKGAVNFALFAPGPGRLEITATLPPVKAKKGKKAPPLVSFGTAATTVSAKGTVTVTLAPSHKASLAIKALKGSKQLKITVTVVFTPTGGTPKTTIITVNVGVPPKAKKTSKK